MPNVHQRGRAWPIAIAGILFAGIASNVGFAILASSDPAAAVEPDYYRKAVAWDQEMAQEERNIALGWSAHSALILGSHARRTAGADAGRQPRATAHGCRGTSTSYA